jgi:hypothetical protein
MSILDNYKFNSRIRELIEKQKGSKIKVSNIEVENIIDNVLFEDKINKNKTYDTDEKKLFFNKIIDLNLNNYEKKSLESLSEFIKLHFNNFQINNIVECISKNIYFPGKIIKQIRIYNDLFEYFITLFNEIKKTNAIIINSKFIGDIKKIYPDVIYDEDTAEITTDNILEIIDNFFIRYKQQFLNLNLVKKDDIIFIISDNIDDLQKIINDNNGLILKIVPIFYLEIQNNNEKK